MGFSKATSVGNSIITLTFTKSSDLRSIHSLLITLTGVGDCQYTRPGGWVVQAMWWVAQAMWSGLRRLCGGLTVIIILISVQLALN